MDEEFYRMLGYARIFSDMYGCLDMQESFATNDGYTYDKNGEIKLGKWVKEQVKTVDPNSEKGQRLTEIGILWDYGTNKIGVYDLCREYRIDTEINRLLVNRLSYAEFKSKINYLKSIGLNLVNNKGELVEVFFLRNNELFDKYGVTKEGLIRDYFDYKDLTQIRKY